MASSCRRRDRQERQTVPSSTPALPGRPRTLSPAQMQALASRRSQARLRRGPCPQTIRGLVPLQEGLQPHAWRPSRAGRRDIRGRKRKKHRFSHVTVGSSDMAGGETVLYRDAPIGWAPREPAKPPPDPHPGCPCYGCFGRMLSGPSRRR